MILAELIVDGDAATYAEEALFFLLFLGGALFFVTSVVLGQNPALSTPASRKRSLTKNNRVGAARSTDGALGLQRPANVPDSASAGGKDKRRSLRRDSNPIAIFVSDALIPGDPVEGLVLNRSRGGLCLSVPQKADVGQLLAVRTADFPQALASVQLRVRHCKQTGEAWRLGCQFVDDLPWSTVLLFG
jgi:hypothetical protein